MKRYRFGPQSWPNVLRGMFIAGIVLVLATVALVTVKVLTLWDATRFLGPPAAALAVYGVSRQRRWWRSFEIVVDEERLLRRAAYCGDLALERSEIVEVSEAPRGWLVVEARSGERLVIPSYLEGLPELRATLETWAGESRERRTAGSG